MKINKFVHAGAFALAYFLSASQLNAQADDDISKVTVTKTFDWVNPNRAVHCQFNVSASTSLECKSWDGEMVLCDQSRPCHTEHQLRHFMPKITPITLVPLDGWSLKYKEQIRCDVQTAKVVCASQDRESGVSGFIASAEGIKIVLRPDAAD